MLDVVSEGVPEANALLEGIKTRAKDPREFLDGELVTEAHRFFEDQFATAGAAGGEPWAPLAPITEVMKAAAGLSGMGILRATDELYRSLTQRGDPLGEQVVDNNSLEVGTMDPIAGLHQEGQGRIPARVLVPETIPDEYTDHWAELALEFVEGP